MSADLAATAEHGEPEVTGDAVVPPHEPAVSVARFLPAGRQDLPTHPLEIAAALEAGGCRDADARALGWPDVFALADHLFAQGVVERLRQGKAVIELPDGNDPTSDPSRIQSKAATERHLESQMGMRPQWRVLLRGVLFALPGLVLAGALPYPMTSLESAVIWITLALSWGLGQGLAYGGYMRVSLSPGDARTHIVTWVVWHALASTVVIAAVVASGAARPLVGLVAFTQSTYLLAASGLMVLGLEMRLYALLSVGAVAGIYRLVPPFEAYPSWWGVCLATGSMLLVTIVLVWACRPSTRSGPQSAHPVPRTALASHVLMGLTSALLVLWLPYFTGAGMGLTFILLPLVLSLGGIEWLLLWLRGAGRRSLATASNVSSFRTRTTRALGGAAMAYFVAIVILVSIGSVGYLVVASDPAGDPALPIAVVILGMVLFFSAVATALYGLRDVLASSIGAVLLLGIVQPWGLSSHALAVYYSVVCLGLAVVTYCVARRQVRIPGNLA